MSRSSYDYIVVGSGSGGAPVAHRLSEAGATVLIIEAGRSSFGVPEIEDAAGWFALQQGAWDWGHTYSPTHKVYDRQIAIPRGKALGGSSSINAMMWYRGVPDDYDRWNTVAKGWSWNDCLPTFRVCESWLGTQSSERGVDGPLKITPPDPNHPLTKAMMGGSKAMGLPELDDPNGPESFGVSLANFNIAPDGKRWTSADGYLQNKSDNLIIKTETLVTEILVEGSYARGVRALCNGKMDTFIADQGVVIACGALETPRLLMLSGIGPEDELKRLGISLKIKAEAVGQNLQDHPLVRALNFKASKPLGAVIGNGGGTLSIWKSHDGLPQADLVAFPIQGKSATPELLEHYDLSGDIFAIGLGVLNSHSSGHMRLTGPSPNDPLHIQPNLLGDERDLKALIRGVEFLQEMVATDGFGELFGGYAAPDKIVRGKETEEFVRRACSTFYHCCGTARMGDGDDAPVSSRLGVKGVEHLWVADASIIPHIPACHTHAPVTMIGERTAQFILEAS